ncbi:MAG: tetrathionate reductase family octaheme c-type cytochrome [Sulfuricellaceae bacterium]|nr:tetrathionate reductase family octaheme c-type cytochrome [Sulfuricellaceae bacterium]
MLSRSLIPALVLAASGVLAALGASANPAPAATPAAATPAAPAMAPVAPAAGVKKTTTSTADHSKFKELQKDFKDGPEVTKACLSCHTEAAKQVQKTKHWTWEFLNPDTKQSLGKKNVINNFCTAVPSNYQFCTACHVGYGWKDNKFDFTSQNNVDCLVCHDNTSKYRKLPGLSGHPPYEDTEFPPHSGKIVKAVDLKDVAQNVGKTTRETCGACHFYGGGGDAVKHGDLDSSLKNPAKYLDVHMAKDGLNFTCGTCHATTGHDVPGSRYAPTASVTNPVAHLRGKVDNSNPATCQSCHGNKPHETVKESAKRARLDQHADKIACQTCHIPEFARGQATKMSWDWSTAGKMKDGKPYTSKDSAGKNAYDSKKGDFTWEHDVIPTYTWFNGKVNYTLRETKLDPSKVVKINSFEGSAEDGKSKIWPMKVFTGKQPYDTGNNQLLVFHTYGKDDSSLWSNFNWDKAMDYGMKEIGAEYSGKYAFISTEMAWPITHMVAPKNDALTCAQCHDAKTGGRLKDVKGIYMPGRGDNNPWLDKAGWILALLTLIGVILHGAGRIYANRKG